MGEPGTGNRLLSRESGHGTGRKAWSFRARVLGYLLGFVAFLTVALSVLLIHAQQAVLRVHFEEDGRTLTHLFADSVRLEVAAKDVSRLVRSAAALLKAPSIVGVVILDREGNSLVEVGFPSNRGAVVGAQPGLSGAPARGAPEVIVVEDADHLTFWRAVVDRLVFDSAETLYASDPEGPGPDPKPVGYVAVSMTKARLREGLRTIVARSLGAGAAFMGLGILLAFRVARDASRPLERLVEAFRKQGIAVGGDDEIGVLRDTFSTLVRRLERAFLTIKELNETLEQRVAERTRELALANHQLRKARDHLEERVRERTVQLEAAHRKLLQAEKLSAVGKLAASLAHEINNPIFGIRNVLQELQNHPALSPGDRHLVELSIGECNRIAALVRSLRDFHRPQEENFTWVDVHACIEAMLTLCRKRFAKQRVRVETFFSEDVPMIWAVEDHVKQVILNLLTNAAEALPDDGGTIRVSTDTTGTTVRIRIEDTGCGIPEEHLEKIFDPFFTTKGAASGTGLGLSVCYGIVKRHGGTIHVESRVERGTVFTVEWPVGKEVADETQRAARG